MPCIISLKKKKILSASDLLEAVSNECEGICFLLVLGENIYHSFASQCEYVYCFCIAS